MRVKKYVVDSMPEAMKKIRQELGKDAVIINTKPLRVGGFLGLFATKKLEVVAAIDVQSASIPRSMKPLNREPIKENVEAKSDARNVDERIRSLFQDRLQEENESRVPQTHTSWKRTEEHDSPMVSERREERSMSSRSNVALAQEDVAGWRSELTEMKLLLQQVQQQLHPMREQTIVMEPIAFATVRSWLVMQGIRPAIVNELLTQAQQAQCVTEADVFACVERALIDRLTDRPIAPIRPSAKLVHLVGPTGVGKTTTLAKLAAEQVLKYRKSIALITSDTYRIAAVEQLRTYASILDIPMETVVSPMDLERAVAKFSCHDMIFMDTAGRNYRNELAVSELHTLLRTPCEKDTYLVLSLTTKYSDMMAVTEHFVKYGIDKVLLTKADETDTFGSVINLLADYPLALSYVTHGQSVPDDIQLLQASSFVHSWGGRHVS